MEKDNFITSYGFFSTIVVTVVGIGIFSYPREIATFVGGDVWFITIAAGLINLLVLKLAVKALQVNDFKRITVIIRSGFGSVLGGIILVITSAFNITAISLGMRAFVEVVKMYLLEKTPTEFLILITILTGIYLVRGGIRSSVKFNEITLWIMFLPLFVILLFALGEADFSNLLPVLHNRPDNYLKGVASSAFAFGGFEIIYLAAPLLKVKKKAYRNILSSTIFILFFYILVAVLCIAVFSPAETKKLLWPTITLARTISIPGSFVERWDGVVLALWVIFYFTTFSNGFTFSSYLISDGVGVGDIRISSLILVPFIYYIAMMPTNLAELFNIIQVVMPVGFIFNLILLPVLLIIMGRRRHEEQRREV
ncbi:MAG: endospore germination permease [Bacillota bacterium]|nr:endospore germination permease [Bacillota bacterium]